MSSTDENMARALDRALALQREQGAWTAAHAYTATAVKMIELASEAVELAAGTTTDAVAADGGPPGIAANAKTLHDDLARTSRTMRDTLKDVTARLEDARERGLREAIGTSKPPPTTTTTTCANEGTPVDPQHPHHPL